MAGMLWAREVDNAETRVRLAEEQLDAARAARRLTFRKWIARGITNQAIADRVGRHPTVVLQQAGIRRRSDLVSDLEWVTAQSEEFQNDC